MIVRKIASQSEICNVINDKLQGSSAKHFRCDQFLYCTFIVQSADESIVRIGAHLPKIDSLFHAPHSPCTLSSCRYRTRQIGLSGITCALLTDTVANCSYRQINLATDAKLKPALTY